MDIDVLQALDYGAREAVGGRRIARRQAAIHPIDQPVAIRRHRMPQREYHASPLPDRLGRKAPATSSEPPIDPSVNSRKNFWAGLPVFRLMLSRPRRMPSIASIRSLASPVAL